MEVNEANHSPTQPLEINEFEMFTEILNAVQELHGDFGAAAIRSGFYAKYCNKYTRIAVIRCRHGPHQLVSSSLPFINKIESKTVCLNQIYLGATIRQCFKFIKTHQETKFNDYCLELKTDDEKEALRKAINELEFGFRKPT